MQCPACHNEVGPQATFCNHCGAPLAAAPVAPPTPSYAPVAPAPQSGYAEVPQAYTPPPASYAPPAGYAQQPPQQPPQAGYPPQAQAPAGSGGLSDTAAAALSYVTVIPAIIFLLIEPYNKTPLVRFHSIQSIGLAVSWFALWIIIMILMLVLHFIPFIGGIIGFFSLFIYPLIGLGFFILWLLCVIKASKGEWFKVPIIGNFALAQAQK